jgi:hypothetical protein
MKRIYTTPNKYSYEKQNVQSVAAKRRRKKLLPESDECGAPGPPAEQSLTTQFRKRVENSSIHLRERNNMKGNYSLTHTKWRVPLNSSFLLSTGLYSVRSEPREDRGHGQLQRAY